MTNHEKLVNEVIPQKLREIEESKNVRILHCVESGSRAWGFASPDSDYDVRFIYVRKLDEYLRLEEKRDVIEWQLDDTLDINGWDLQKSLRLLHKSNPTFFEWRASPLVYKTTPQWQEIADIAPHYFQHRAGLYHYLNTARHNTRDYLKGDVVRLKKYFYSLRPILACRWIIAKNTPPPMLFSELVEECLPPELLPFVTKLLEQKAKNSELGEARRMEALSEYIESSITDIGAYLETAPRDRVIPWDELNDVFKKIAFSSGL